MSEQDKDDIKREHSPREEKTDYTDYQELNFLGRAEVLGAAEVENVEPSEVVGGEPQSDPHPEQLTEATHGKTDYNDNADLAPVDPEGQTNG